MRLKVHYRDTPLGRLNDDTGQLLFQYDESFLALGLELSPLYLPNRSGAMAPSSPFEGNLPGLFADSLPDYWGRAIVDRRLREAGILPSEVSILKRLSIVGARGLGALSYYPEEDHEPAEASLAEAITFARAVIEEHAGKLPGPKALLEAGSNPGGRFPKMLANWNPDSKRLLIGAGPQSADFLPCLLKLDMGKLSEPHHRDLGAKEFDLLSRARKAKIDTANHWLIEGESSEGPYAHLLVQRFDRNEGQRIHMHTFGGVTHQLAIRYGSSYEDLLRATRALTKDHQQVVQQFRRMVFNVLCGNRDDHVRNHSFLYDDKKGWKLSPAYDLTPTPEKSEHALSIKQKWSNITESDLLAVAQLFSIDHPKEIIVEVREALTA